MDLENARAEAEARFPVPPEGPFYQVRGELNAARVSAFISGARFQAEQDKAEIERLIKAVHGEIDDLYERLYEAAHCGSARECQLMVLALLDKDGETE